ncbi:serine hydrolase domain-containing protein [Flavilitoribacter nigricans]|uniref:Beta-lactamase-related domain-containing protein n=1 Tax=Flavilitoribacter nigricans (strain ATCC 23147 / DSM 23189 / NBRC 102662 / NCIMB 1420 / SS-2) TaxID=1122177 RepID=A0A2D0N1Z3_FLAN2|nr:serine hydrolase [Flavilitoribacter nigricans]PHN02534.1 hypothetical protein CRP01_31655 [Flavilitoribacter nigricans DSM 23189 = NBRC 102662]
MRKYLLLFSTITVAFLILAFIVKAKYYYYPYPNLIEYFLSFLLLLFTLISLIWKNGIDPKKKLLTGFVAIVVLMGVVNLFNYAFKWHPLNLNPPFSRSQSFEVDYEPYAWASGTPEGHGYADGRLSDYLGKLDQWERLRGLLVVKDDQLIVEKYLAGATRYSAFNVHSVTKSITSALVGLAIQDQHIKSENELVLPFFPEYKDEPYGDFKRALTLQHLLSMRGGWAGGDGFQTVEQCITSEYLRVMPDTEFRYFTGSQNILSAIVSKATGQSTKEFADRKLFNPLGMQVGFWKAIDGYYLGGDESYYTARDLARFGALFLHRGHLDGQQILDSTWVSKTFTNYTSTSDAFRSLDSYDEVGYGLCWWLLRTKDKRTLYAARGKGGQHIILIPDKNIIAVIIQEWNPLQKNEMLKNKLLGELLSIL